MKTIKNKIITNLKKCSVVAGFLWMIIIACSEPTSKNLLYDLFGSIGYYGINLLISTTLLIIGGVYNNSEILDEDESIR